MYNQRRNGVNLASEYFSVKWPFLVLFERQRLGRSADEPLPWVLLKFADPD